MRVKLHDIRKNAPFYLLIAPDMILFAIFILIPLAWTVYMSFFQEVTGGGIKFVGLANYVRGLRDPFFTGSFGKAAFLTVTTTSLGMTLGLVAAYLVDELTGLVKYLARAAIFTPTLCALVVSSIVWKTLLLPDGFIQRALALVGITTPSWLSDPALSILSVIIVSAWQSLGTNMVFFLAGLQGIPREFHEAAMVDGASAWDRLRWITLPLLSPVTLFLLVINSLNNFKMFDQVMALTRGGPMNATLIPTVYIYRLAFAQNRYGYASAIAVLFAVGIFAVSLAQLRILRSQTLY
jgi:ABC-type sugar transport system permease subunit